MSILNDRDHISQDGIVPDAERTAGIDLLTAPQDVTQLQSFLGSVQFYRQHIFKFAEIAFPLYKLLKKGVTFSWGKDQQDAF